MRFETIIATVSLVLVLSFVSPGYANGIEREFVDVIPYPAFRDANAPLLWEDIRIPSRPGVRQRLLIAKEEKAGCQAVMLFTGGKAKWIAERKGRRLKLGRNFLIRSAPLFARAGLVTVLPDLPSDRARSTGMSDAFRTSQEHYQDIRAAIEFLASKENACGIYLIGTSRGTMSVGHLSSLIKHPSVKGYVFTASLNDTASYAENIERPALVVHHIEDACWSTRYENAQNFFHGLPNLPRKHFITVSGGDEPKSRRPCKARTQHGFYGVERETVAAIVEWINGKTPPKHVAPRN